MCISISIIRSIYNWTQTENVISTTYVHDSPNAFLPSRCANDDATKCQYPFSFSVASRWIFSCLFRWPHHHRPSMALWNQQKPTKSVEIFFPNNYHFDCCSLQKKGLQAATTVFVGSISDRAPDTMIKRMLNVRLRLCFHVLTFSIFFPRIVVVWSIGNVFKVRTANFKV